MIHNHRNIQQGQTIANTHVFIAKAGKKSEREKYTNQIQFLLGRIPAKDHETQEGLADVREADDDQRVFIAHVFGGK